MVLLCNNITCEVEMNASGLAGAATPDQKRAAEGKVLMASGRQRRSSPELVDGAPFSDVASRLRLAPFAADPGETQDVGGAWCAERYAGGDDDALSGIGEAFGQRRAAGLVDHVGKIRGVHLEIGRAHV